MNHEHNDERDATAGPEGGPVAPPDDDGHAGGPAGLPTLEARRLSELGLHAAGLVHELRQPLFAAKAIAQMAIVTPGREAEALQRVLEQLATMETLLGGYHDFTRSPTGGPQVFDVWASIRSALVILTHRAQSAGVRLDIAAGPAMAVRGSMLGAQQAIVNLGQNAIDAVRGRPDPRVRIACEAGDRRVIVTVEDNGPGLDPAIRANLFAPFRTTKEGGTGLGLSISRDLVAAFGGSLRLVDGPTTRWEIELLAAGDTE